MDLQQRKLTKSEWDFLEVPLGSKELRILRMIYNSYKNVDYTINDTKSMLGFMKLSSKNNEFDWYLYENYFKKSIDKLLLKYNIQFKVSGKKNKKKIKKADLIRIKNSSKKIDDLKDFVFEFIIIQIIKRFLKKDNCPKQYYTLTQMLKNNIMDVNIYISEFATFIIENYKNEINKVLLIQNAYNYIEKNDRIFMFADIKLYQHQKELFISTKREGAKLILYQAPTGTGKTMSPLGLAKGNRIIFTCVAKHIGLQLAKACISLGIKIAIAFGCDDASDIRLHYFAAKDYTKNRRTGGIFRVDNSVGDYVEVIITDVQFV